jgi:hypothetical protein
MWLKLERAVGLATLPCCREESLTLGSGVVVVKRLGGFAVGLPVTTDGEMR